MTKMLSLRGGKRIPIPKCILCNKRRFFETLSIFGGRISAPICRHCILAPNEIARCEQKVRELFAQEPAFYHPGDTP